MAEKSDVLFVKFNGKNYLSWEFQLRMFIRGKTLWGHIDGSNVKPLEDVEKRAKWETDDARIVSWIINSVESHLVLSLRPYSTAKGMWEYLKRVYNRDNSARRFQLAYDISDYSQETKTIEEYYAGFLSLWTDYTDLIYGSASESEIFTLQKFHTESQRDQFLMKLRKEFEPVRSNLMNRSPVPSLEICLNELLREEQRLLTHALIEEKGNSNVIDSAFATQTRSRDLSKTQCYSCKEYGHIASQCTKKFCNYCKKLGHIISECRKRPQQRKGTAYHANTGYAQSPHASDSMDTVQNTPVQPTITPEMIQQMIHSAFTALGISGSENRDGDREGA